MNQPSVLQAKTQSDFFTLFGKPEQENLFFIVYLYDK